MTRPITNSSVLIIRSAMASNSTTPASSAYPSAYPSEDEDDGSSPAQTRRTFPFLALPSELRNKIYDLVFCAAPQIMDLDYSTFSLLRRNKLFALFRVSRQLHHEASHHFLSTHTFRLFPTYPGRTDKPLLARLPARYRTSITSLELRLGPGWNNPPRGWVVNDALGLADCTNVRFLKVFVEFDASDVIFKGFITGDGLYERFTQALLEAVLKGVPSIKVVEFDAWSSVKRSGDMISGLREVVTRFDKVVTWGPESGWGQESDGILFDAVRMLGGGKLTKSAAAFAQAVE